MPLCLKDLKLRNIDCPLQKPQIANKFVPCFKIWSEVKFTQINSRVVKWLQFSIKYFQRFSTKFVTSDRRKYFLSEYIFPQHFLITFSC